MQVAKEFSSSLLMTAHGVIRRYVDKQNSNPAPTAPADNKSPGGGN
jgi:hypothetical protein